jgi:hypothetical protein
MPGLQTQDGATPVRRPEVRGTRPHHDQARVFEPLLAGVVEGVLALLAVTGPVVLPEETGAGIEQVPDAEQDAFGPENRRVDLGAG